MDTSLLLVITRIIDEKFRQLKLDAAKGTTVNVTNETWDDNSQKVKTLNTLSGDVTISAGTNITLTPTGNNIEIASAGASAFTELSDAPANYTGAGGKIVAVNSGATALEFVDAPAATNGIPVGGTAGQILSKIDGTNYNAEWISLVASLVGIADTGEHFTATDVEGALSELFTSVSDGKTLVAAAITDKGVATAATDPFPTMATNISNIPTGGGYDIGYTLIDLAILTLTTVDKPA